MKTQKQQIKTGYWKDNKTFISYEEEELLKKIRDKEQDNIIKKIRKDYPIELLKKIRRETENFN